MCSGNASMCGKGSGIVSLAGNWHTREYAATASASIVAVRVSTTEERSAFGSLRMPGSWLTPGIDGRAAFRTVGTSMNILSSDRGPRRGASEASGVLGWYSGAQHHLAAHPDDVAVDGGRAGAGVPGDGLRDVHRESALGHGVEALADLAGGERDGSGHLGDDEAGSHRV